MTPTRQDFLAKVPTLTEVADVAQAPTALPSPAADERTQRWVDEVMDRMAPQVNALVSSQLRDMLAPAVQDAVQDAVERCRGPLIEALARRLREILEQELARKAAEVPETLGHVHPRPRPTDSLKDM